MRLHVLLGLVLILSLLSVSAEEFSLEKTKTITYKEASIQLISVGTSKSIVLKINDVERVIEHEREVIVYDIKIKNLDADYIAQIAKVSLELNAECIVDEDCKKAHPCSSAVCNYRKCEFSEVSGCVFNDECKKFNSFEEIDGNPSYCSEDGTWISRKPYKSECKYDYECLSNKCNGVCSGLLFGGERMAPAWILLVIGGLILLEAVFFILLPKQSKDILRHLSFLTTKKLRIIALIEILIALALIIWTLT